MIGNRNITEIQELLIVQFAKDAWKGSVSNPKEPTTKRAPDRGSFWSCHKILLVQLKILVDEPLEDLI